MQDSPKVIDRHGQNCTLESMSPVTQHFGGSVGRLVAPIPLHRVLDIGTRDEVPRIEAMEPAAIPSILLFRNGVHVRDSTYSSSS